MLVVGLAGLPLVALWLDGWRELVEIGGYGLGGALWIHARVRGLLLAAGLRARGRGGDGHGT